MEIHEFYIPSSSGIANLHCMEWIPSGEVKAIVQIAHGMMEHVGRYREFAEFLAGHGIYVLGNDHLGHGKTARRGRPRILRGAWRSRLGDPRYAPRDRSTRRENIQVCRSSFWDTAWDHFSRDDI